MLLGAMEELGTSEAESEPNQLESDQHTTAAQSSTRGARFRGQSVPVDMSPEFGSDGQHLAAREERRAPSGVGTGPRGPLSTAEALSLNPWLASSRMAGSRATVTEFSFPGRQTGYGSQGGLQAAPERRQAQGKFARFSGMSVRRKRSFRGPNRPL